MKPRIVIHPGLPKCATSAIQRAFVVEEHALARRLGVDFLSAGFRTNQGYPDVIKVMDDPQGYLDDLRRAEFPAERYFLSSEALLGIDMTEFCNRFEIETLAVTVRTPMLQSTSNYRFSGWVTGGFDLWTAKRVNHFDDAAKRQIAKVARLKTMPGRLVIVPMELAGRGIVSRFCELVFGQRPELLDRIEAGAQAQVNASISFALADALGRRLETADQGAIDAGMRRRLVKAAQAINMPDDLKALVPATLAACWADYEDAALERYREMLALAEGGETIDAVIGRARASLSALLKAPTPTTDQAARLDALADKIIEPCFAPSGRP